MTALSRPKNILLDTEAATEIVNNERRIYRHEVRGMQAEKQTLLNGQPYNNAVLLLANILMAALFFYVTSLNATSVLPPSVAWAQPLVGGVSAIGAGCLMYGTNAIAYKLPTITDRKSAFMMWSAWLSMLAISAVTSAFLALLLVNGADSELDSARLQMEQANSAASVEMGSITTARAQLTKWTDAAATARQDLTDATDRLAKAEGEYKAWQQQTMERFGQGSADANRRLRDPKHYEHAPHIDAIASAKRAVTTAQANIRTADDRADEWDSKLASAELAHRQAMSASEKSATVQESPWEETMSDMASMMEIFGLNFESGDQFKAFFAVFFALVLTLAPPFWSFQTGASVAPEVNAQANRMDQIDQAAKEARANYRMGAAPASSMGTAAPVQPAAAEPGAAPVASSEAATMGNLVDVALGLDKPDQTLPCGLSQSRFDKLYALNYDKVQKLLQDAEAQLISATGIGALKKRYGGNDDVANMLKHVLYMEGYGDYAADGSISLFNPAAS